MTFKKAIGKYSNNLWGSIAEFGNFFLKAAFTG